MNRTNNICETFHHKINSTVEFAYRKLGILLDKLKHITIKY